MSTLAVASICSGIIAKPSRGKIHTIFPHKKKVLEKHTFLVKALAVPGCVMKSRSSCLSLSEIKSSSTTTLAVSKRTPPVRKCRTKFCFNFNRAKLSMLHCTHAFACQNFQCILNWAQIDIQGLMYKQSSFL